MLLISHFHSVALKKFQNPLCILSVDSFLTIFFCFSTKGLSLQLEPLKEIQLEIPIPYHCHFFCCCNKLACEAVGMRYIHS